MDIVIPRHDDHTRPIGSQELTRETIQQVCRFFVLGLQQCVSIRIVDFSTLHNVATYDD